MAWSSLSVLQRATKADVQTDPFPHIVLDNALPDDLYERLAASYPPLRRLKVDPTQNNARWDYLSKKTRRNFLIPRLWRRFIAYHASEAFFRDIHELFFDEIHKLYPTRFPSPQFMRDMRVGTRRINNYDDSDILMDALISGNTPVTEASSVKTSHCDTGPKLFSGLFYMRRDEDDSVGGDLTISRFNPSYTFDQQLDCFRWAFVDDGHLEVVKTVKYAKNRLVLFINSLHSMHGVTVRHPTPHLRLFVNLVGEVDPPLYDLSRTGRPAYHDEPVRVLSPVAA